MSTIREGDLVYVVRGCCNKHDMPGRIRVVREFSYNDYCRSILCACPRVGPTTLAHLSDNPNGPWVPLSWLKKIPPLSEPSHTERREEIEA
jgi:hypothetical protein